MRPRRGCGACKSPAQRQGSCHDRQVRPELSAQTDLFAADGNESGIGRESVNSVRDSLNVLLRAGGFGCAEAR